MDIRSFDSNAEAYLGAMAPALQDVLEIAILKLAQREGAEDLSWFDELRQEAIDTAKGLVVQEVSVEVDAGVRGFVCQVLNAKFESLRVSLVEQEK